MSEQLGFDDIESIELDVPFVRPIPVFPSAIPLQPTELIPPSEAHLHDLSPPDLTPSEEGDFDRIDGHGQGNGTITNVGAGVETVVFRRQSQVTHPQPKTPRQQGKARWYVLGEKRHPEQYPDTDEEQQEELAS